MKRNTKKKYVYGTTLIELILYISLVSTIMVAAIYFTWDVIYGREKAFQQQIVDQSARVALARIAYEIGSAESIQNLTTSEIIVVSGGVTTRMVLNGQVIELYTGGGGPYNLTTNQVNVTNFELIDESDADNNSKNVKVNLTIEQAQKPTTGQIRATTTVSNTVELNSQFSQARSLLVDLSSSNLSGGVDVIGITIENTGSSDVVIDQLAIDWVGTSGGENLTQVQIGGGSIEFSGSAASGSLVDLADFNLATSDGVVDIDSLTFDSDMSGAELDLQFVTGDGSISDAKLFEIGGTSIPEPPAGTCDNFCTSQGYLAGTCRKNAAACTQNGETHETAGDQFCTGGAQEDTCCCLP